MSHCDLCYSSVPIDAGVTIGQDDDSRMSLVCSSCVMKVMKTLEGRLPRKAVVRKPIQTTTSQGDE